MHQTHRTPHRGCESKAIKQQWLIVHARAARPHAEEIDCSLQNTDVVRKFAVKGLKRIA